MKSVYIKVAAFIMIVGLLSACGSQSTGTPASQPTEAVAPANEAPIQTALSADNVAPMEPAAATEPATATEGATVSFVNDVLPIIESRCVNCHGGDRVEEGLNLKTYDSMMTGSEHGQIVAPGNAMDSKLVKLIVSQKNAQARAQTNPTPSPAYYGLGQPGCTE